MTEDARQDEAAEGVKMVVLSGRLGVKAEHDLSAALIKEVDTSEGKVLLDMTAVDFVSSSGLRALMMAYKQADATGKKIAMAHVHPGVYKIFKLTASDGLFHVFDNRNDALAWLSEQ